MISITKIVITHNSCAVKTSSAVTTSQLSHSRKSLQNARKLIFLESKFDTAFI